MTQVKGNPSETRNYRAIHSAPEPRSIWPYECHTICIASQGHEVRSGVWIKRSVTLSRGGHHQTRRFLVLPSSHPLGFITKVDNHSHHLDGNEGVEESKKCFIALIKSHPGSSSPPLTHVRIESTFRFGSSSFGRGIIILTWISHTQSHIWSSVHKQWITCGHPPCRSPFLPSFLASFPYLLPHPPPPTLMTQVSYYLSEIQLLVGIYYMWSFLVCGRLVVLLLLQNDRPAEVPF